VREVHRGLGIRKGGEKQQFELRNHLISDTLEAKNIQLRFSDETAHDSIGGIRVRMAPIVVVQNLQTFIEKHLNNLNENTKLTNHDIIPKNEIWIKLLGDKGGSSFKMCFQVMNVSNCNSPDNTVVFTCIKAPDSYSNLKVVLNYYVDAIDFLDGSAWLDKTILVFLAGDIAFISTLLGLSSAASTYPCFFCLIDKTTIQTSLRNRDKADIRTIQNIKETYNKFIDEVQGDKKKPSKYYNVINEPILDIDPAEQVCPP
jgi:hypothetical protein